ncbi:hypothetical protein V1522DRAFT_439014 [Lipomyces starkeyi]
MPMPTRHTDRKCNCPVTSNTSALRITIPSPTLILLFDSIFFLHEDNDPRSKVEALPSDALQGVSSGITLLCGGFGLCGVPDTLIDALKERSEVQNIMAVSNNAGTANSGLSKLLESGQVTKMIASYIGSNKIFEQLYLSGEIDLELTPQGTLAERCRAGGAGIPAFYVPTGYGKWVQTGELPVRYDDAGNVIKKSNPKEVREFEGRKYLLERGIFGDVAFIKAYKADTLGNCYFRLAARNFNSTFGRAVKYMIVEAEHIVEPGAIAPEDLHLPGIYVSKVIQSTAEKKIEFVTVLKEKRRRERIIRRAAKEFKDGDYVNLGIGRPMLTPNFSADDISVTWQSENGILGLGPYPKIGDEDADLINAGKETVTVNPGSSVFGSDEVFAMIKSDRINLTVLVAHLVVNPTKTRIVVVMYLVDKKGCPRILKECEFPLSGTKCGSIIIADVAVFDGYTAEDIKDNVGQPP